MEFGIPKSFDFYEESKITAVLEACDGSDCSLQKLCPECEALRTSIERKLRKAFALGQIASNSTPTGE